MAPLSHTRPSRSLSRGRQGSMALIASFVDIFIQISLFYLCTKAPRSWTQKTSPNRQKSFRFLCPFSSASLLPSLFFLGLPFKFLVKTCWATERGLNLISEYSSHRFSLGTSSHVSVQERTRKNKMAEAKLRSPHSCCNTRRHHLSL